MSDLTQQFPELASVEAFAEYLLDDDRTSYSFQELSQLSYVTRQSSSKLIRALAEYGFRHQGRPHVTEVRGFLSPSDRWLDCPTYATTGNDQILGFAGPELAEVEVTGARRPR